jgi:transcriptional regulator
MEEPTKFVALKLISTNILLVKEPNQPVCLKLSITESLTDTQMRLLALATPWNPITIGAHTSEWNNALQTLDAEITAIETHGKLPVQKHHKTLRWGLVKRKRGFISHDV